MAPYSDKENVREAFLNKGDYQEKLLPTLRNSAVAFMHRGYMYFGYVKRLIIT